MWGAWSGGAGGSARARGEEGSKAGQPMRKNKHLLSPQHVKRPSVAVSGAPVSPCPVQQRNMLDLQALHAVDPQQQLSSFVTHAMPIIAASTLVGTSSVPLFLVTRRSQTLT